MMADIDPSVWLFCGAIAGSFVAWMVLRGKASDAYRHGAAEGDSERATIAERLSGVEAQLQEARATIIAAQQAATTLNAAASRESELRAAATAEAARVPQLEALSQSLSLENASLQARLADLVARLEDERRSSTEKLALLDHAQRQLGDAFKALSAESLRANNQSFLDLAKTTLEKFQEGAKGELENRQQAIDALVKPLRESLDKVGGTMQELEKTRVGAYASLGEQIRHLTEGQTHLTGETANLVRALRAPTVRGRWGEIQLKRVVELAGMLEYCDFIQQETHTGEDDSIRPDLIVRLPNQKLLVVDAKAPLQAYLESLEATDDLVRVARLKDHARQIRAHLLQLGAKDYWAKLNDGGHSPEFVVLFLPGEVFFSAALEQDPSLIEYGVEQRVILATPTTLIALLKAVAYGWRQEQLAANAQQVANLGRDLYKRISDLAANFDNVRKYLEKAVESYNLTVGTLEGRVLPAARRFKDLGAATGEDIPLAETIDKAGRMLQSEELKKLPPAAGSG